jgi:hypothetical protein
MRWRRSIVVLGTVVGALMAGPAAQAKGPSQGVLSGPGLPAPVSLGDPGSESIGQNLADMIEQSGFFSEAFGGKARGHKPSGELGPRYTVTYTMGDIKPVSTITQSVYPFADAGPATSMEEGQAYWGNQRTPGGWFRAKGRFKALLIDLGVPRPVVHTPVAASAGGGATGSPFGWMSAALLAAIVAGGAFLLLRRARVRA